MKIKINRKHSISYLNSIKYSVQQYYSLELEERNKKLPNVYARFIYFKLARELTTLPLQTIGDSVKRGHATVLHGVKEIENIFKYDPKIFDDYLYLKNRLALKIDRTDAHKKKDYIKLALYYRNKLKEFKNL